jgi:hypothetical protein
MAPTLLALAGYEIPPSMQGHALVDGSATSAAGDLSSAAAEEIVKERLRGLGYLG